MLASLLPRTALMVAGLATVVSVAPHAQTPRTSGGSQMALAGPLVHENLTVYLLLGAGADNREYVTLDEGLSSRTVVVKEKGSGGEDRAEVNALEIENRSNNWLFLQAGDIVKGGKQDRTIYTDLVIAPHSKPQSIEAFCVERGRWSAGRDGLAFASSPAMVSGAALKKAIQSEKNQSRVWQEVARAEEKAVKAVRASGAPAPAVALSNTGTYNAIVENRTINETNQAYVTKLFPQIQKQRDAAGMAVVINGSVAAVDVYGSPALFQKVAQKLLKSYALEAVLARDATPAVPPAGKEHVQAFLAEMSSATPATEGVGKAMQRSTRETKSAVAYEYEYLASADGTRGAQPVHRSYLKK